MSQHRDEKEAGRVVRASAGDREAFDRIAFDHSPRLLALASRILGANVDAESVVQEALASAWLALDRFDPSRALAPWLTTITINKCRDAMRHRRFERWLKIGTGGGVEDVIDARPSLEERISDRQMIEMVQREIARLPTGIKEPFVLVTFDDRSHAEAAEILGISRKAVETRIRRARNVLRERLEDRLQAGRGRVGLDD